MYKTTKRNKHLPQVPVRCNCEDRWEAEVCVNKVEEGMKVDRRCGRCLRARGKSIEEVGKHCEKKRQW